MPKLPIPQDCCGCSSCANKCPKHAIKMQEDEGGFLQPTVDSTICVECGVCEKACPALANAPEDVTIHDAYLVQHKDEVIRRESTSGGAFTAISQAILDNNGLIYGAIITEDNVVKHASVTTVEGLSKFRNSKYVQSKLSNTFKEVKKYLNGGIIVCFSGTPCQIAGLKQFIGKECENLITVDVVCHAIPSPLIFRKYIELTKKRTPTAHKIVFRDKKRGYSYSTIAWYDKYGNNVYRASYELDEWYRLFLHDKCDRSSCYMCKYQNQPRVSDITIWDCYNACDLCPSMDDNKGVTNVIVWTEKGKAIFEQSKKYLKVIKIDSRLTIDATRDHRRNRPEWDEKVFYKDAVILPVEDFFRKYAPRSFKAKLASDLRYLLWKVGLHDSVRKVIQRRRS